MNAIMFPGQGSQYVGMGRDLFGAYSQARNLFIEVDSILGYELSEKCFSGSTEALKDTATQQLAIVTVSLAAYEVFKEKNIDISFVSGLSLGEYSCLYAAGVVGLKDIITLVRERAQAMQTAAEATPSTMFAVIGMVEDELRIKAKELGFYIANSNSPQQTVISFKKGDSEKIKAFFDQEGIRAVELAVSGGFHCPFMEPAREHLAGVLENMEFRPARIPVVSNFTARSHTDPAEIKKNLLNQLVNPVLWYGCVRHMLTCGVGCFYEIGPSKVLRGLMRRISPGARVVNIEKAGDLEGVAA